MNSIKYSKSVLFLILSLVGLLTLKSETYAMTVKSNGYTWVYSIVTNNNWMEYAVITSVSDSKYASSVTIPAEVPTMYQSYLTTRVTEIGSGLFAGWKSLSSVSFPNAVTNIGSSIFENCNSLSSVSLPSGITWISGGMFKGCSALKEISIPTGVKTIGAMAFANSGLRSVSLPYGATTIGNQAFQNCYSLTSVNMQNYLTTIGAWAFESCHSLKSINIPNSVLSIGSQAFQDCTTLVSVALPDRLSQIETGLFLDCSALESVNIPSNAITIGHSAFKNCSKLWAVSIPNSVTSIRDSAFQGCSSLSSMSIPSGVTSIGNSAFADCSTLPHIEVATDNPAYESIDGVLYTKGGQTLLRCPGGKSGNLAISNGVVSIAQSAFSNCVHLSFLSIPNSVTNIGSEAFIGCSSLKTLVLPPKWRGTQMLSNASVPSTCVVKYWDDPDPNISITPTTRDFGVGGGAGAILVAGNGMWEAFVSDDWIVLDAETGSVGYPVAYAVDATTQVESRTGYVYVSGHIHTVTQAGVGGSIAPESATFESEGGTGTIAVSAPNRIGWKARANCDWMNVTPTSGEGSGSVKYTVDALDSVSTRQGTLTVAGETFTVFQYGRRMMLSPTTATYDYFTHVIPITVNALALTEWSVEPKASWISVVDAGNGRGGDLVTIAIAENPSVKARTGMVRIGTEIFTVTQEGRTELEFSISPEATTASVEGANGLIVVTATPDLPWSAESKTNWLTVYSATANGAGTGNVAYSVAPNPTLDERIGSIVVTPGETNMAMKTHTVIQPAAVAALSSTGYEFEAAGESCEVGVTVSGIVQWQIENSNAWLTVVGSLNRVGPGTVTLQALPNETVYPKTGTVTIAKKTFKVSQKARGVEVEYDTKLFGADGGYESISIHPDGQASWTAVASDKTWITIFKGDSGTGDGEILYVISPYVGTGAARTGTITVGNKVVYITQRAYDLSIDPTGAWVPGNNGAGEFGVSAGINDVWTAIVTEPWITLVEGYDAGTGNGVVRFLYTENDTGKTRTGKIIVAGEVYTLQQRMRQMVLISANAEHGGTVSGAGNYDLGTEMTLTAIPDSGYTFSYWTGDVESMENPLKLMVDVPKSFTAVFAPLPIAFTKVTSATNGVTMAWNQLAWATTFRIFRGVTSVPSSAEVVAELPNTGTCEWLDETGEVDVEYWYWIEAEGLEDEVMSDPMTGKKKWGWPAAQNEGEVAVALDGAADARLGNQIGTVEEYEAFRTWAAGEGREEKEVRDSAHAWPSYALGAEELFENEPVVVLGVPAAVEGGARGKRGAAGSPWVVSVTVKDGEKAAEVDANKVAALFECTGDLTDWAGAAIKVSVEPQEGEGEALRFWVRPEKAETRRAFLRIGE